MVGDEAFAQACQKDFGDKLFRHVYGDDIIPCVPPCSTGKFEHFRVEYRSTPDGWLKHDGAASQAWTMLVNIPLLALDWLTKQLPRVVQLRKDHPLLSSFFLPYSIDHHSPLHYLPHLAGHRLPGTEMGWPSPASPGT